MSIPEKYQDKLYIHTSDTKGRSLYTKHKISAGTVFATDTLFLHCIDSTNIKQRCSYCYRLIEKPLGCSQCKQKYYCNTTCQRAAWKQLHWLECYCLHSIKPTDNSTTHNSSVVLLLQLILEQVQKHAIEDVQLTDELTTFSQLCQHVDSITDESAEQYDLYDYKQNVETVHNMGVKLVEAIKHAKQGERNKLLSPTMREKLMQYDEQFIESSLLDKSKLLYDLNRLQCNIWTISDQNDLSMYGHGLSLFYALINHSCVPNTMLQFQGATVQLIALYTIPADTELTYTYIDLIANTSDRREKLKSQYSFVCDCQQCTASTTDKGKLIDYQLTNFQCNNASMPSKCAGFLLETTNPLELQCTQCQHIQQYATVRKYQSEATLLYDQSNDAYDNNDIEQAIVCVKQAIQNMLQCVSQYNMLLYQVLGRLSLYANITDNFQLLLPTMLAQCYCIELCLPNIHAQKGLHYKTIGDIAFELHQNRLAIQYYTKAQDILSITHGSDKQLLNEISMKLKGLTVVSHGHRRNDMIDVSSVTALLQKVL